MKTFKHHKLPELVTLLSANIPVLLHGERGSGKTTVISQAAEELFLDFYAVSMTRQTTLSYLFGFINVNGIYVPSLLRTAIEEGGLFLLDELDAADPNVILALNTIENGFVSFPDKIVHVHKDFRLVATANPFNDHSHYTGRATLDAATLDRFDKISLDRDPKLEASLVSEETQDEIARVRQVIKDNNVDIHISMRDAMRLDKRKSLNLAKNYIFEVLLNREESLYTDYKLTVPQKQTAQEDVETVEVLWELLINEATNNASTT
jgi:MoxR-like ATPase